MSNAVARTEELIRTAQGLLDEGMVDRRMYSDPDIYELELERVFARSWLPIGHESQIPNPGDFFESYMGEESVIMCRNRDGEVRVLLNSCRHRGNKVCRAEVGNANTFLCQYHGWTYDTDGKFAGAPRFEELYEGHFEKERWGLPQARVQSYKGLVFATWDENQVDLEEYLGDFTWIMDMMLDRFDGGVEVAGGTCIRWTIPMNWKFGAENSGGDSYHGMTTHKSAQDVRHVSRSSPFAGAGGPRQQAAQIPELDRGFTMVSPLGHGVNVVTINKDGAVRPEIKADNALNAFYIEHAEESIQRLGAFRAFNISRYNMNVFPTCAFHTSAQSMHVLMPKGPRKTEIWLFTFVPKNAPEEAKREMVREAPHHFGPSGFFEEDDGENWQHSTASSVGVIQRRYPFNYQLSPGGERKVLPAEADLPERIAGVNNEYAQLSLMRRWHELMLQP